MKRLLLLSACIVLGSVLTANADGLFGTFTNPSLGQSATVTYTRTAQSGTRAGLDLITLNIGSLTGTSDLINGIGSPNTSPMSFTGTTSSDYFYILDDTGGVSAGVSVKKGTAAPGSYVNFEGGLGALNLVEMPGTQPTYMASVYDPVNEVFVNPTCNAYSTLQYGWGTTSSGNYLGVGGILGKFYVPTGKNLDLYNAALATTGAQIMTVVGHGSTVVPEPSTLALLASGLIGLMAYAWRKRK